MKKALWSAGCFAFAAMMAGSALAQPMGGATNYPTANQNQPMGSPPQGAGAVQPMASPQGAATQEPLNQVSDVASLNNASVQDASGNSVGTVQKVMTGSSGKPTAVSVDAGAFLGTTTKVVSIKASNLKYDRNRNILTTTLTKSQIKALPASSM